MARQFSGSRRRQTTWIQGPSSLSGAITATGKTLMSGQISDPASFERGTIVRIRGSYTALQTTGAAAGDGFAIALGIGLFDEVALAAGVASLPGPLDQMDWDGWIWHSFGVTQVHTATIADGVNSASSVFRFEVDSKAMRKWDVGVQVLAGVIDVVELGTASFEVNGHTRVLLKGG